jgi:hypothetical protein
MLFVWQKRLDYLLRCTAQRRDVEVPLQRKQLRFELA